MADRFAGSGKRTFIYLAGALFAAVLFAFLPATDNDFVAYDDADYVTSNPMVQQGLSAAGIRWAFRSTEASNWHPLTWLSHMADVQLFGSNPAGHHLTSVVIHALNAVLLFVVLHAMTGATWRSFFVAALFGLHPLRVESVAWVSERKDVLSTLFWMLTLWAYAKYAKGEALRRTGAEHPTATRHRFSLAYCLALLFFALGLMSKPMLVTLPFALLLLDYWPLGRLTKARIPALLIEKVPFLAMAAAASAVTFSVQSAGGSVDSTVPLAARVSNAVIAYVQYLGKLVAPVDLACFYPLPARWPGSLVFGAALLLIGISAAAAWLRRRQPAVIIGWLWYLGTLVPVIGFVAIGRHAFADRYTYIPSVGILLAVVWGAHAALAGRTRLLAGAAVVAALASMACIGATRRQTRCWRNTETLCRQALRATKDNDVAHYMLGGALIKQGRTEEAVKEFLEALRINPLSAEARNNWGVELQRQGKWPAAIREYREAIRLRPRFAEPYYNLAIALDLLGRTAEARENYLRSLAIRPTQANVHFNLGNLLLREGDLDGATREFQRTLDLAPNSADALNNLGVISERRSDLDRAIAYYRKAIAVKPDDAKTYFNFGVALQRSGRLNEAIECYRTAAELKPDFSQAQTNLADALALRARLAAPKGTSTDGHTSPEQPAFPD